MNMSIDHRQNDDAMMSDDEGDFQGQHQKEFSKYIDMIWKEFMKSQNNLSNSLSIEHLAILLETLDDPQIQTNKIVRTVPGYLTHRGHPNLIVCPGREQIPTLFMRILSALLCHPLTNVCFAAQKRPVKKWKIFFASLSNQMAARFSLFSTFKT